MSSDEMTQLNLDEHPVPPPGGADERSIAAWRQWLSSMATDAEAALSAAIAYREMDGPGRDNWISSLESDAPEVEVPKIALYAPLLAVETDPSRRNRLVAELSVETPSGLAPSMPRALLGCRDGTRVYVLASSLYLDFVQILACGVCGGRFTWVRHDPISRLDQVPQQGDIIEGARLENTPVKAVLDDLAQAILSHQRKGESLPEALSVLAHLLRPLGP